MSSHSTELFTSTDCSAWAAHLRTALSTVWWQRGGRISRAYSSGVRTKAVKGMDQLLVYRRCVHMPYASATHMAFLFPVDFFRTSDV